MQTETQGRKKTSQVQNVIAFRANKGKRRVLSAGGRRSQRDWKEKEWVKKKKKKKKTKSAVMRHDC